ncbi:hypothetical protein MLD38_034328 [Melastoma candidum]|uniref:Uncharacterized protein n=1 Tax=Melastoma candidum TaxID=119954 RepID=A0ACB9M9L0_9MYRT|nr:hypothetical protein MLD38_034328 [Melastoma candidum]
MRQDPIRELNKDPPGDNYPMGQFDDCNEELSNVEDYHLRHKVCQVHSNSDKASRESKCRDFSSSATGSISSPSLMKENRVAGVGLGTQPEKEKDPSREANSRVPGQGNHAQWECRYHSLVAEYLVRNWYQCPHLRLQLDSRLHSGRFAR